jgi:hypothetical protein
VARLIRIGAWASIRAHRANMLPGVSTDVGGAGRQPLNPVSNTPARMGDVAAAMQKLVSEKAARKAKSSAAALIQQEARGAACITPRGALDVKMPPLPPGSACAECDAAPVRPCRDPWLTRSRAAPPAPSCPQAKPPTSARPSAHSFEMASAARQRVHPDQCSNSSGVSLSAAGKVAGARGV